MAYATSLRAIVQDNRQGTLYDVSDIIGEIEWTTKIDSSSGTCKFKLKKDQSLSHYELAYYEGATVSITIDEFPMFFGYILDKDRSRDTLFDINNTAYDQLWYLKNEESIQFDGVTATQMLQQIITLQGLNTGQLTDTSIVLPPKLYSKKSFGDMMTDALQNTTILDSSSKEYLIYDNFGKLTLSELSELKTDLVLGDASLVTGYDYSTSVSQDSFNNIVLVQENQDTGEQDRYEVFDSQKIKEWGTISYYKELQTNIPDNVMYPIAQAILKDKDRTTHKLKLNCIGDFSIRAGSGIYIDIQDLADISVHEYGIVTNCTHKIDNAKHTMDLDVAFWREDNL